MKILLVIIFLVIIIQCQCKRGGSHSSSRRKSSGSSSSSSSSKRRPVGWHLGSFKSYGRKTQSHSIFNHPFIHSNYPAGSSDIINNNYYNSNGRSGLFGNDRRSLFNGHNRYMPYRENQGYVGFREWKYEDERRWRYTTKASYFHNQVPGTMKALPAAAVLGAATAFGVVSLLPLSVSSGNPLLSCELRTLNQIDLMFNDNIYTCWEMFIFMECPLTEEEKFNISVSSSKTSVSEAKIDENFRTNTNNRCRRKYLKCHEIKEHSNNKMFCDSNIIFSSLSMFCNSTFVRNNTGEFKNESKTVLQCYEGQSKYEEVYVPTKSSIVESTTTIKPTTTTMSTWDDVKFKSYSFLMWSIGRSDLLEKKTPTTTTFAPPEFWEVPFMIGFSSEESD